MYEEEIRFPQSMDDIVQELIQEQIEREAIERSNRELNLHILEEMLKEYMQDDDKESLNSAHKNSIQEHEFRQFPTYRL